MTCIPQIGSRTAGGWGSRMAQPAAEGEGASLNPVWAPQIACRLTKTQKVGEGLSAAGNGRQAAASEWGRTMPRGSTQGEIAQVWAQAGGPARRSALPSKNMRVAWSIFAVLSPADLSARSAVMAQFARGTQPLFVHHFECIGRQCRNVNISGPESLEPSSW